MNKLLLQWFCFLNLIFLHCAFEYGEGNIGNRQAYSLHDLITNSLSLMQTSSSFNDESPASIIDLQFSGINFHENLQDDDLQNEDFPDGVLHSDVENFFQNSSKCVRDIIFLLENIKSQWALSVFDSFGKPESGILQGNFKWVGDYNECIQVHSTNPNSTSGNFRGRYCSLTLSLPFQNLTAPLPLSTSICVPDSCSPADLLSVLTFSHKGLNGSFSNDTQDVPSNLLTCKPTERHLNGPAKAVIALLSLFCTFAVLGSSITAVKYFKGIIKESKRSSLIVNISESDQHVIGDGSEPLGKNAESGHAALLQGEEGTSKENGLITFLVCFCIFTNGAKLLNTDASEGQLLSIHGIRFLSMSWVILGHSYAFCFQQLRNIMEALKLVDNFPFQIVLQGFYSVDSFFVLSGFLLTYLSMKEFSKAKGSINWPYFYIHRYIRLTPIYMVVLGFSATVFLYIGSGPFWPDNDLDPICRDNWWWNLLYINNFSKMTGQCMGWAWYLANDMQFFVISPIFLITLWRWPKVGYGLLGTFLAACWLSNFFITYHYNLSAGMTGMVGNPDILDLSQAMTKYVDYFDKIYIKPYTRIAPYLIGMLTGYLVFKRNSSNNPKHSLAFLSIGWVVATSITLTCVYGLYHAHPSVIASSFYNALHRSTFAVGLSWVIYVCLIGQGGVVDAILSYKFFIPLSRLTYTAYLIHPMIITGYYGSMKTSLVFSHSTVVFIFLGIMVVTYALSLPVALILESPIISLEKMIRKSFSKKDSS